MNQERVTHGNIASQSSDSLASGLLQRKCACGQHMAGGGECTECIEKRTKLQRRAKNQPEQSEVASTVDEVLSSPGMPLDRKTRVFMESRFGHDFSNVRVYTDTKAAESAHSLNANAYTVGSRLVFGQHQYQPSSSAGRQLIAHELTHSLQQNNTSSGKTGSYRLGSSFSAAEREADAIAAEVIKDTLPNLEHMSINPSGSLIQRDLATPPPAVAPPDQANLTEEQIRRALAFNRTRYDEANTRLIQDLLGGPVTGTFTEDNIIAIAATQEEFGLRADGMVGNETFQFLNREQRLEGSTTATANCLVSFGAFNQATPQVNRNAATNSCTICGVFRTESQFSERCDCSDFEYRQFIRGHFHQIRGGAIVADLGATQFGRLPAGSLTAAFQEDGDLLDPTAVNYGHRANPASANPEDHYIDAAGADDQADGCRYRSNDHVGFCVAPGIPDCRIGDVLDANMSFRGEIQRNGTAINTKHWSAIRGRFPVT